MALAETYDAIILDLRLPDTSGLTLLEHLRANGVTAPVLVLTGYADLESAVAALRLGVVDFRRKPLIADELVAALQEAVNEGPTVRDLLARVDRIARSAQADGVTRERLIGVLMLAVESPLLGIPAFVAGADALRYALTEMQAGDEATFAARVRDAIWQADTPVAADHVRVKVAFAMLEEAVTRGVRPTEHELAAELGVDPAHLGRLIRAQTGRGFGHWRRAFAIRVAVRELADPDVQIAQIAFRSGYEHPSQLDREFRRTFGISPREYRRLRKTLVPPAV